MELTKHKPISAGALSPSRRGLSTEENLKTDFIVNSWINVDREATKKRYFEYLGMLSKLRKAIGVISDKVDKQKPNKCIFLHRDLNAEERIKEMENGGKALKNTLKQANLNGAPLKVSDADISIKNLPRLCKATEGKKEVLVINRAFVKNLWLTYDKAIKNLTFIYQASRKRVPREATSLVDKTIQQYSKQIVDLVKEHIGSDTLTKVGRNGYLDKRLAIPNAIALEQALNYQDGEINNKTIKLPSKRLMDMLDTKATYATEIDYNFAGGAISLTQGFNIKFAKIPIDNNTKTAGELIYIDRLQKKYVKSRIHTFLLKKEKDAGKEGAAKILLNESKDKDYTFQVSDEDKAGFLEYGINTAGGELEKATKELLKMVRKKYETTYSGTYITDLTRNLLTSANGSRKETDPRTAPYAVHLGSSLISKFKIDGKVSSDKAVQEAALTDQMKVLKQTKRTLEGDLEKLKGQKGVITETKDLTKKLETTIKRIETGKKELAAGL